MKTSHPLLDEFLESPVTQSAMALASDCKELPIYQLHFPDSSDVQKEAHRWAQNLFTDCRHQDSRPEATQHENRLVLHHPDGHRVRAYYASGCTEYRHLHRAYAGSTQIDNLEAAQEVVNRFADRHSLWPLDSVGQILPHGLELVKSQGAHREGLESTITLHNAILIYQRLTSNIPWIGPGSQISAIIEGDDVVGFDRHWRHVMPSTSHTVNIIPLEEVFHKMLDRLWERSGGGCLERGALKLERVEFGYYASNKYSLQRSLQPAYQIFYRSVGQISAAIEELILAHGEQTEAFGIEAASANTPVTPCVRIVVDQETCR
jgi:hypothetical protein